MEPIDASHRSSLLGEGGIKGGSGGNSTREVF